MNVLDSRCSVLTSLVSGVWCSADDLTFVSDLTWNLYLVFRGMHEICSAEYLKLVNTLHLESNTFIY
jgi:hypothetical protein